MKNKRLTIYFEEPVEKISLGEIEVIEKTKYKWKIEIKKRALKKVLEHITTKYSIADIVITDPPIEEIIETIYKK